MTRIEQLRWERGLNKGQVCRAAGISRPTLNLAESGVRPSAPVAKKLADFYELTVAELLANVETQAA